MAHFRLKRLEKYGLYTVFIVDGEEVRNSSSENEEFAELAIHVDFPGLIPSDEIWIEDTIEESEYPFLVANAILRLKLTKSGMSDKKAYDKATEHEISMRKNSYIDSNKIYVNKLFLHNPFSIWLVNGAAVRNKYKVDFVQGGTGGKYGPYSFIPESEIWIEAGLHKNEWKYVIVHEWSELHFMKNLGMSYNDAHKIASKIEYKSRKLDSFSIYDSIPIANKLINKFLE